MTTRDPRPTAPNATFRIGQVARQSGLTVRTLHHYDAIGLLCPSVRTESGHRRYATRDLSRLQQIVSLRAVGLALSEIGQVLDAGADPRAAIERHLAHLRATIAAAEKLAHTLEAIAAHYRAADAVSADDLLHTIRLTTMFEKHYTPEQLSTLKQRAETIGADRIARVQQAWARLFAEVQRHLDAGTPPEAPELAPLAAQAEALIGEFTGGDAGVRASLDSAVRTQPEDAYAAWGISPELGAYYARVMSAHGCG